MAERTYTEQEVFEIIERAAELQMQAAQSREDRSGLTLSELETVARETGLDPAHLRRAVAELDEPGNALFDASARTTATHVFVERWVPGALTPDAWEDIVAELRHRLDTDLGAMMGANYQMGTTEQIGRTLEWKHMSMSGIETRAMLRPRGDGVRIRLSQRVGWGNPVAESATYGTGLAFLAAVIAGLVSGSGWVAAAAALLTLIVAIPLILYADPAWRRKKHQELHDLADSLSALVATPMEVSAGELGEGAAGRKEAPSPAVDPSLLDRDRTSGDEQTPPSRNRTRA
ncbi:MAG: hypothetical protein GVY18_05605 [Bacteroidetes bacterium]|jgi:hypothetical protein|nr:hypothetical protein [Bacteroidota bacterium]